MQLQAILASMDYLSVAYREGAGAFVRLACTLTMVLKSSKKEEESELRGSLALIPLWFV